MDLEKTVKPSVELTELDFVVNVTQEKELDDLMQILEVYGKITWPGQSPVEGAYTKERWKRYREDTCINLNGGEYLSWGDTELYRNIESFEGFCNSNKIDKVKLKEINNYFENVKKK